MGRSRVVHELGLCLTQTWFDHFRSPRNEPTDDREEESVWASQVSPGIGRLLVRVREEQIWKKSYWIWQDLTGEYLILVKNDDFSGLRLVE